MNTQKIKLTILLKSKLIFHNTDKLGTYGADLQKSLVPRRVKGGAGDVVNLVFTDCTKISDACTNL